MTSYVTFALGTVLIVGAGWMARQRLSVSARPHSTNDDIAWL